MLAAAADSTKLIRLSITNTANERQQQQKRTPNKSQDISSKRQQQKQIVPNYQERASPKQHVNDGRSSSEHLNTKAISTSERQQQQIALKRQECSTKNQSLTWLTQ
ncbi:hypothetical protein MAM1_0024d02013 [Mucor ambiguus]|uniref:Uncharacterized protein n=1 Tax=Mucor ambiguus TaxID=91626 RepID=A0A0C9M6U3_9FUNG|nr:hypothetical protein MAM1_0024d02013 [Mucor ambiguus]